MNTNNTARSPLRPKQKRVITTRQIHELLYSLGIGRHYLGHDITAQALQLILTDKDRLLSVKEKIYLPIAAQRQCDWRAVERNIRTVIRRAWMLNRPLLEQMAIYPLEYEPSATEFLDILTAYLEHISA